MWSALVLATNAEEPARLPRQLEPYERSLKRVFGYNQFEIIGQKSIDLGINDEQWLLPSRRFFMRVGGARKVEQGGFEFDLALFHDKKLLVDTTVRLGKSSPLLIRGPQCGKGQLIIVLEVE